MPSTIQRMETGIDQLLRVADVVEIRRSDKCLSIIGIELLRYAFCCARYCLSMAPSLTLRTQQIPCVLLGPVAQLHASTVGRTYDSNPGCENFLYIIKRGAGLRAARGAVLGRPSDGRCPSGLRLKDSLDRDAPTIFLGFTRSG